MATFVFTYRMPAGFVPGAPERLAAWRSWFEGMGAQVVARGNPVIDTTAVGDCGPTTHLGGYSLITAEDLDAALALAKDCPAVEFGGVEVGQVLDVSA